MSIHERTENPASTSSETQPARSVVFFAYPKMGLLDLTGAQTVFYAANHILTESGLPGYTLRTASLDGGPVQTAEGLVVDTERLDQLAGVAIDTLLVPGTPTIRQTLGNHNALVQALRCASSRSRRTVSVCSGTFLLAAAGLLDGLRVATHWLVADLFERQYPQVELDREAIFIQQGSIWTSAGVSAGIDLALALVEADAGRDISMQVARRMVVYYRRPDNQDKWGTLLQSQYT